MPPRRLPRRLPRTPPSYSTTQTGPPLLRISNLPATSPANGHIRVLELDRPAARNALSRELVASLRAQIQDIHAQYGPRGEETGSHLETAPEAPGPTRALVLASAVDACFCAGADLKERTAFTPAETTTFLTTLRQTLSSLASLPIPAIAAIAAPALGGGLELALAAHLRVMASTATVALPETRLGIIPGAGGTARLPAVVGLPRARDMILTGRRVAGPEAYRMGLADRLVDVEAAVRAQQDRDKDKGTGSHRVDALALARTLALAEAVRLAGEICEGGPVAIRAALRAVACGAREEVENDMYERVVGTEDRDEALRAFADKRKPVFRGR